MKILYFAWLREQIGHAEEDVIPPPHVTTVGALTEWLASSSPAHRKALTKRDSLKVAVDQTFARDDTSIAGACEIAYFPPFTGG